MRRIKHREGPLRQEQLRTEMQTKVVVVARLRAVLVPILIRRGRGGRG